MHVQSNLRQQIFVRFFLMICIASVLVAYRFHSCWKMAMEHEMTAGEPNVLYVYSYTNAKMFHTKYRANGKHCKEAHQTMINRSIGDIEIYKQKM